MTENWRTRVLDDDVWDLWYYLCGEDPNEDFEEYEVEPCEELGLHKVYKRMSTTLLGNPVCRRKEDQDLRIRRCGDTGGSKTRKGSGDVKVKRRTVFCIVLQLFLCYVASGFFLGAFLLPLNLLTVAFMTCLLFSVSKFTSFLYFKHLKPWFYGSSWRREQRFMEEFRKELEKNGNT